MYTEQLAVLVDYRAASLKDSVQAFVAKSLHSASFTALLDLHE